jgi:LPS O-antigen subunit length determinant protein (WzzB/FepE family)
MSADSTELVGYLISALWIITGLCAIVVASALAFFFLTAKAVRQAKTTLPELHQLGAAKDREKRSPNGGLGLAVVR